MKRPLAILACCSSLGLGACGKPQLPCEKHKQPYKPTFSKPQLCVSVTRDGWENFPEPTRIGEKSLATLRIYNDSAADLLVTSVVTSGEPEFRFMKSWDADGGGTPRTTVNTDDSAYVALEFAPLAVGVYPGALTIESNAENSPSYTVVLSGCAVTSDGGTISCYP